MDPMTFLSRLAALIRPPRSHVLSYYGVLAAAAARRDEIVPTPPPPDAERVPHPCCAGKPAKPAKQVRRRPERIPWPTLLEQVFSIDILRCVYGGRRRVLAMVRDPATIDRISSTSDCRPGSPPRAVPRSLPFANAR
jgi:hypothetical protein